jgi:threonine dehydrogenase-like Zn-dependent dehydrogenase
MSDTMLAAVFEGNGQLSLMQRPIPKIVDNDDIILKVGGVGICGSDLHILHVPPKHPAKTGVIMGHEFAGQVVDFGSAVRGIEAGDRVAVDPNPPCGTCTMCRKGFPNACLVAFDNPDAPGPGWPYTPGQWWDGGMAEFVRVKPRYIYKLPDTIPYWQGSVLEPLGCVLNGVEKADLNLGETVVIHGAGPIGLSFVAIFRSKGAGKIIVSEPMPARANLSKECGADIVINPKDENAIDRVMQETNGMGAEVIVDAVGNLLPVSIKMAAFGGRILLFGVDSTAKPEISPLEITAKEIQVRGAFITRYTMSVAIKLLESKLIPIEKIVSHRLPLEKVAEGRRLAESGEAIKVVLEPNQLD